MKMTTKIVLCAILFAFSMQSTAMAEWKFKSPGEIAKNLGTKAANNPQLQKAAKEKLNEEAGDKDKAANSEDGTTISTEASEAINVILKNNSSSAIEVELIDQYGGNYSITLDAGASQNHTVKMNSEVKVKDGAIHVVTADDEGKEVSIAGQ